MISVAISVTRRLAARRALLARYQNAALEFRGWRERANNILKGARKLRLQTVPVKKSDS